MLSKHYSQTRSMRRVRLWISISSLRTWISISTNIWVLFRWQTNSTLPSSPGTTLSGHLLLFSFLFGAECQGFNLSALQHTGPHRLPPHSPTCSQRSVGGRQDQEGLLRLRWSKQTQSTFFKSFSPQSVFFMSYDIHMVALFPLLCITVEFLSNHICHNIADCCSESVNAPLSAVI